jgi:hypothetical protein
MVGAVGGNPRLVKVQELGKMRELWIYGDFVRCLSFLFNNLAFLIVPALENSTVIVLGPDSA